MLSKNTMLKIGDEVKVIGKTAKNDWEELEKIPIGTICIVDSVFRGCIYPDAIRVIPKDNITGDGYWYPENSLAII